MKFFLFIISNFIFAYSSYGQVLSYHTKIKIENGVKTTERICRIQINSKADNELSRIRLKHGPNDKFNLVSAKIIDATGKTLRKLKKKDIITKNDLSYGTFYQDDLIEEFDLFWNEYPYQIEYNYHIKEDNYLYIAHWYPVVYLKTPTFVSSLQIELPLDYKFAMNYDDELKHEKSFADNKCILKWNTSGIKPIEKEIYSPPLLELIPKVAVMALDFKYGINGNSESWASFGSWLSTLNKTTDELPFLERIVVDKLIDGVKDEREIIKILYHYLQDKTKYVNVAIDVGGLKSYPASYVCSNKYGDCKALTTYMKAMLNHVGITSFYTIINAGGNATRIDVDFPSQQFNHVILCIPQETDTIWLENTSNISPFNYLGDFTQNRYALIVDEHNSKLVRTPVLEDTLLLEKRIYNFNLDAQGKGKVSIVKTLGGNPFERYRYFKTQLTKRDQEERLQKEYSNKNFELLEWEILDNDRDHTNLQLLLNGNCKSQIRSVGNLKVISPLHIKLPKFEDPKNRKQNVRINYPINKMDSVIYYIDFLESHKVVLPPAIVISSDFGSYKVNFKQQTNKLVVTEYFKLKRGDYSLEEYPRFHAFISSIIKYKKSSVILLK